MNVTRLALQSNRLTLVLAAVVVLAGISTFLAMPRAYDPGFIVRTAQIVTYFPGASPERVEQLISSRLETLAKELPELDFVKSESRTGVSIVLVNIKESYTRMRPIWDNLRRKVEDARDDFPDGVMGPFVNDEFGDVFGIVLALTGEGFSYTELNDVAENLRDALQQRPDVAKVEIHGAQEPRIFAEYDNARLAELGISPYQLSQALATRNIVISGGTLKLAHERIALEPSGNFESLDDIRHTVLRVPGSSALFYLKDIAHLSRGYVDPPSALVHSDGVPALAVAVSMREGGNNIALGEQVQALIAQFRSRYPWGLEFELATFSPTEVDAKIRGFVNNLLQAVAVVTLVMLVTLGLRTGLVVATLIPLSMLLSLLVMNALEIGLDQISLAALIIALGMLVDNGIVMSESILVRMQRGVPGYDAALGAATELRVPLLTASLTTAAAFLPIYLSESSVGEFTASLFKVVSIALLSSWLISLTLIPLLCATYLKVVPRTEEAESALQRRYGELLRWLLDHKAATLVATLVIFAATMAAFDRIPKVFFPPSDRTYFKVELELPTGTDITETTRVVADLERFLAQHRSETGVASWISYIGNAGPRFLLSHNPKPNNAGYALMVVNMPSAEAIAPLMARLDSYARQRHPDLQLKPRRIENGPAVDNPVEIRLSGQDSETLFDAVDSLKRKMAEIGGLTAIGDDWGQRVKKLEIHIDQARALRAGVTSQDIAVSLQAGLNGLKLTEFRDGEEVIPVLLRSQAATQNDIGKVRSLSVYAQASGRSLPLTQVADIRVVWEDARILRRDGRRTVTLGARPLEGVTAAAKFAELHPWLESRQADWGLDLHYELGGEAESSDKANRAISAKLPIAGLIILVLLVAQFNSLRKALIVLTTIPLGLIGVALGLLAADSFFGFMTLLGIISLAGIVINNAIVLLESIQQQLDAGVEPQEALVAAAQQRARPILLTTATTVLGLIPLYLGGGAMWEPMAIAIMAGLLFSTVMTLGVIPVLYALLYRVRRN